VQFNRKELIMPSGYVMPREVSARSRPYRPSLALRVRVWLKGLELDAALAGGADPAQSDELALRAKQLAERLRGTRPPTLRGLAMTSLMLEDGRDPLTADGNPATLERAVRACLSALDA
jgi:hypothetical protein